VCPGGEETLDGKNLRTDGCGYRNMSDTGTETKSSLYLVAMATWKNAACIAITESG